jgi:NAD(P)H-dependent FMN reductase
VWAQAELRKVLSATGARVTEGELALGHAQHRFDESGRLTEETVAEQLREVVEDLATAARDRAAALASQAA